MPREPPKLRAGQIKRAVKMRKMKKPHSPEEIQRIVQETGLSKAEVEEVVRRRDTAFVEHGTDPELARLIKQQGFRLDRRWVKFQMRKQADREHIEEIDRAFDMLRPERLKNLSRVNSHYFFPSVQGLKIGHGYWGKVLGKKLHFQEGGAKVRARVNSVEAYVFEQTIPLNSYLMPPGSIEGRSFTHKEMAKDPHLVAEAKKYWNTGIPLKTFNRRYKYDRQKGGWVRQPGPKSAELWPGGPRKQLPEFYLSPEVLVSEEISTENIRINTGKKAKEKA